VVARLERTADGFVDTWLGRQVAVLPLTERNRDVLVAFAHLDTPHAERVLKVDAASGCVWLAEPMRANDRQLRPEHRASLERALGNLHQKGVRHGAIDHDHIVVTREGIAMLLAPRRDAHTDDLASLASLFEQIAG
jgi:hypothetical protein